MYCQVVYLRGCHPGRIRHALSQLPETLDETYERTLRDINRADWELAHRLFQCVAVASRPLRVEELAEFLAFDFKSGPVAKFHEGWRLEDPVDAVLSTCSTLLALVNVDGSSTIQFSHFSVKEFLTSGRLAEANDETLRRYHISMTPAHTLIAQACLGILIHLDTAIIRDDLQNYPLAEYAGQHWVDHARFENVSQRVEDGMKKLFDPTKSHLATWVWICDPRNSMIDPERAERPLPPGGTALHYAAVCGLHAIAKFLAIEYSQDIDSRGFEDNWTPLHVASAYGHMEVARVLIEEGADATAYDNDGNSPLHVASKQGHVQVARFLVDNGTDVIARPNHDGRTPLHVASIHGNVEVSRFLVENRADVTARSSQKWTPLHDAATYGRVGVVRFLIEQGVDVTARGDDGRTPLHLACSYGYIDVVRILVEHGADPTAKANDGQSPLHVASSYGNLVVARNLVEYGADVTARDDDGWTPLHYASSCGGVEVVRFLVERGADATARDHRGWTPWDEASSNGHVQVTDFLVQLGAHRKVKETDRPARRHRRRRRHRHRTPSPALAEKTNAEVARIPVKHGAYPTARARAGWTPLHVAAEQGNTEVVRILIEHGEDATARADNGWTPLHVATELGNAEVARLLVEHGADVTAPADDGRTPLHVATESGNVDVIRVLVEHRTVRTDTTTARLTQRRQFIYYVLIFCFFLAGGIYLQFIMWTYESKQM